jgi:ribonuclease P protein component
LSPGLSGAFCSAKTMKAFGFGKAEKLKSRKEIESLFAEGKSLAVFPLRVKYRFRPFSEGAPVQVAVSVSKKGFRRATDRNRIKRLLREAYRLQKAALVQQVTEKGLQAVLFFMYTDKEKAAFDVIFSAMTHCLNQLSQKALTYDERPR